MIGVGGRGALVHCAQDPADGVRLAAGADPSIVREFLDYIRHGAKITTSAVATRYSVAVGCMATHSLRNGGIPVEVPRLLEKLAGYFDADVA